MKTRFKSPWANRAAQAGITLGALAVFLAIRPDIYGSSRDQIHSTYQQNIVTPRILARYLEQTAKPKVQIGAGPSNEPGWLNTDIDPGPGQAFLDATKPMPFRDGSIYYIFSEHVVEHLFYDDGLAYFKEAHRVLAPGGKIRTVTPNLMQLLALFEESDPEHSAKTGHYVQRKLAWEDWAHTSDPAGIIVNNEMHWFGHQFIYTPKLLRASLEQAGFTDIRQYAPGETSDATFSAVERRPRGEWKDVNAYEAMAFEATK
ncbi:MAG TPA: methyltransferase domain-containing protein [Bryobacteraceae bacterium]